MPARDYLDRYVNPPDYLEEQRKRLQKRKQESKRFPRHAERDVLGFILSHAPLENWERDVLGIIRDESYYFLPQRQTKVMNEGWATYWHSRIMTEKALAAIVDEAARAAKVKES